MLPPAIFAEEEATMHQVFLAAESGKFNEAQSMMDKVLRDHPNSAKAHFVEAELLAKQGLYSGANVELNTAERLQPGLPFVKPETLQKLKLRISSASKGVMQPNIGNQNLPDIVKDWMPSILWILGIGLIVLFIAVIFQRNTKTIPANSYPVGGNGTASAMGQATTGGMGSGLMGNLASGAALGAGVVAGEALMNHFIGGNKNNVTNEPPPQETASSNLNDTDDMGGTDFGISDASSWDDDGGIGGDDDWT